jgi:L-iditol 2-dehydrogenase
LVCIYSIKQKNTKIIAIDIDEYRINKAMEFGADLIIDAREYSVNTLKKINDDRLADVVIVCAAAKQAIDNALFSVDRKGKILFFAVPETDISIPSLRFWRDEITVTFSYGAASNNLQKAIALIDSGMINVRKMITHMVRLSDIMQGFKLVTEGKNSLKVVVVPDND